jgi:hypothetical protein
MNTELDHIKVCTVNELEKFIPGVIAISGTTFVDMKELITNLIFLIESSKEWEFVQYIQSKPSLFVIKKKKVDKKEPNEYERMLLVRNKDAKITQKINDDIIKSNTGGTFTEDISSPNTPSIPLPWK